MSGVRSQSGIKPSLRHRRAVGAAVRRAVGDEVLGAVEEEAGSAAVRRVPPGLLNALPCACPLCAWNRRCSTRPGSAPGRGRWVVPQMRLTSPRHLREHAHHEDQHPAPVVPLERESAEFFPLWCE